MVSTNRHVKSLVDYLPSLWRHSREVSWCRASWRGGSRATQLSGWDLPPATPNGTLPPRSGTTPQRPKKRPLPPTFPMKQRGIIRKRTLNCSKDMYSVIELKTAFEKKIFCVWLMNRCQVILVSCYRISKFKFAYLNNASIISVVFYYLVYVEFI